KKSSIFVAKNNFRHIILLEIALYRERSVFMAELDKNKENIEEVSEQLAAMLNDEEIPVPTEESGFLCKIKDLPEGEVIAEYVHEGVTESEISKFQECNCCNDTKQDRRQPCSRLANFCCIRSIPDGLTIRSCESDFRVVY